MDAIKSHGRVIGTALGVAAVATGLYMLFKKAIKDEEDAQSKLENSYIIDPKLPTSTRIKIEYEGNHLALSTITQVFDAIIRTVSPKFKELTRKDREERRANRNNIAKYVELWNEYSRQLQEYIEEAHNNILQALNISLVSWQESNAYYMTHNSPELMVLHASLPQKLKAALPISKNLDKSELKKTLLAQIELFEEEIGKLDQIRSRVERPEEAGPILQNMIYDHIFEDFGVEEEDIIFALKQNLNDPEINSIFQDLHKVTMKLVQG